MTPNIRVFLVIRIVAIPKTDRIDLNRFLKNRIEKKAKSKPNRFDLDLGLAITHSNQTEKKILLRLGRSR